MTLKLPVYVHNVDAPSRFQLMAPIKYGCIVEGGNDPRLSLDQGLCTIGECAQGFSGKKGFELLFMHWLWNSEGFGF